MIVNAPTDLLPFIDKSGPETVPGRGACHRWTRGINGRGYAQFRMDGGTVHVAHIWLHKHTFGPIEPGMVRDHTCHNLDLTCPGGKTCPHRRCLNLDHIEVVGDVVNILRGRAPAAGGERQAAKTHCPYGHPYDDENTYICTQKDGGINRLCRTCRRERARRRRANASMVQSQLIMKEAS